ncbi:unnamed protein product [Coregonus sp. 'balchen']|nr:unnamed protein product [Coregonus sp. 'balchen']
MEESSSTEYMLEKSFFCRIRAVPLLAYHPQDLIGTLVLLHLHPSDRPLMLATHRKILQYMGQPFDHSIRFCARNGEYVTIDTSWSSFVKPWSRKVSFVTGRHKVCMGPVNEDVFAVSAVTEGNLMDSDIQEIPEQIHRLLLQPVHNMGSSGYGSHGSNGSHEQLLSVGLPSETNGNAFENRNVVEEPGKSKPRTFQEICKGVHMLKSQDQQDSAVPPLLVKDSTATAAASVEEVTCSDQTVYSYQQISCLDNPGLSMKAPKKSPSGAAPVVGGPLALPSKVESVVSITSLCSYSSTIVHVGDKKPQPESALPVSVVSLPTQEKEAYKKLGLTKQVLAVHTHKEKQAFLTRCKELCNARTFQKDCSTYLHRQRASKTVERRDASKDGMGVPGDPFQSHMLSSTFEILMPTGTGH